MLTEQTASFKRSSTLKNCLAVTPSHIFAAQSDKAVINIYNRSKQNLESTVPFQEKFTVIEASGGSGAFLAGGTDSGRLTIWETATGRFISTPQIHLQKVTCIAFDFNSNFVITGSADSNVYVWSLASLLDIRSSERKPERILDRHQREITAISPGRIGAAGPTDIMVTASKDSSCIVWDYRNGTHLRTYILSSVPTALALDPVDRAFYAGLEDGTVQSVSFHSNAGSDETMDTSSNQLFSEQFRHVPVTLSGNRWHATDHESPITSMGVVYEGNYLVTGTEKGTVSIWDIATGHVFRTLAQFKSSVTTIKILPPNGFVPTSFKAHDTIEQTTIKKPRYDAVLASASTIVDLHNYALTTKSNGFIHETVSASLGTKNPTQISNFTPLSDSAVVMRGMTDMRAYTPSLASKHKVEALESELAMLYDHYDRLAALHRDTWDGHARWLLENASTASNSNNGA
ncbi:uncharacterized protein H6S33_008948 [Morchella sextelata]|uniref:uncharacterized protein n=1 Tax=Morchella sextelata TaxID=1174677 RepID=UPI001D0540D9|nr:uncharacterized protein H6S33_008948 [Morchella sextelata]KAH0612568.1 hypothetical protein H6S33_008948 [Morchella sextelata]